MEWEGRAHGVHANVVGGKVVDGKARDHSVDLAQLGNVLSARQENHGEMAKEK
jgi:hypothetical protein